MIQVRVEGVFLDLYDTDPIKLNFTIEDIVKTEATSTYSKLFRVPGTSKNNEFFKNAFLVNGYDFDITEKKDATILFDGAEFTRGQLRLQKIFLNEELNRIDYEVLFLGEVRSLSSSIGEGTLSDLNLSGLTHDLTLENIITSWGAFPEGTTTDGLLSGNVIYPLVDFGNNYDSNGDLDPSDFGTISFDATNHFTQNSHPLTPERFRPMIRAKYVFDKIFSDAGFTYESDFLNSDRFKQLYISAWGNTAEIFLNNLSSNLAKIKNNTSLLIGQNNTYTPFLTLDYDYGNNIITQGAGGFDSYEISLDGTYSFRSKLNLRFKYNSLNCTGDSILTINFRSYINGTSVGGDTINILVPQSTENDTTRTLIIEDTFPFNTGDIYWTDINLLSNNGNCIDVELVEIKPGSFLECYEAPGQVQPSFFLDDEYKKIDFIKDILTTFRLVLQPDKIINNHFKIEPWSNYIGTGEIYDWSDKIDLKKDIVIQPLFLEQNARMVFTYNEDKDFLNTINQDEFKEVFGTLIVDSQNELLKGTRTIKIGFGATPVTQIEGANLSNNGMGNTIVPQIHYHDDGQHLPIKAKTRLLFYNGLQSTGVNVTNENTWYAEYAGGTTTGFTNFPMVSYLEDYPVQNGSLVLTWQREPGYILFDLDNELQGRTIYEEYWADYVNTLYDKFSRRLTGYFILEANDLRDFNFNDVIFLRGEYFYVEKIENAVIGEDTPVKVSLIKLLNYNVNSDNFVPPIEYNIWNTTTDVWSGATFTWND